MLYSRLVHSAMDFAALAHQAQRRKKADTPFISHCAMVGAMLQAAGLPETVVAAGLLHDIIEDTDVTLGELEEQFGSEIAELVNGVSEKSKSQPWAERKTGYLEKLRAAPDGSLAIVAADKIHNINSMLMHKEAGGDLWSISKGSQEQQLWYFRTVKEILHDRFGDSPPEGTAALIAEFENALELLEKEF